MSDQSIQRKPPGTLRVALVFPAVRQKSVRGVPPANRSRTPDTLKPSSFHGESLDFVLFPEGYVHAPDRRRIRALSGLAMALRAPLLVGAVETRPDASGRLADWQVLLHFKRDGTHNRVYTKHSTADAVAFGEPDWDPRTMLPTFELVGEPVGATICHDHYLGLLQRSLSQGGARVWVNPSYDNVTDLKWSSVLRLRAVENRLFSLCTLHDNGGRATHPFGYSPDGHELLARRAGTEAFEPLSACRESDAVYIVDLDMSMAGTRLRWSAIPLPTKPKRPRNGAPQIPIQLALRNGEPCVRIGRRWRAVGSGCTVESNGGRAYVEVLPRAGVMDAAACVHILDRAQAEGCVPVIWNHWRKTPTDPARIATLMMGRAIECCAPIVVSDLQGIHEVVELSNRNKIPARRTIQSSGEAIIDLRYAWGWRSAFKMVAQHLPRTERSRALDRYRSLA